MNVNLLEELVRLMAANDLNTVDVRDGDKRIILKRGTAAMAPVNMVPAMAPMAHAPAVPTGAVPAAAPAADADAGLVPIKSPMVGTFYSKPNPESKPFVNVGSAVTEETDVCLIEAMKTFNNIKAGCRGTIAKVLVQDGEVVQFDTALFLVKPA